MKIVVTGGSGFLGSHVVEAVVAAGHECLNFDVAPPAAAAPAPHASGTLLSVDDLRAALRGADAVCHLAGVGDVYLAGDNPPLAAALNVTGSANVAEACLAEGVGRLVYASTWEVYGHPNYQPMDEAHPCEPDHPYNITKLAGERIALTYDALKGLPVVALRLGTAYGARMRPNSVFSIFIRRALDGNPITIKGTGAQWRQFTHAADIARAFLLAATGDSRREVFNIVSSDRISIRRLAEMIAEQIPTSVVFEEARSGDIAPGAVSAQKAARVLGWEPQLPFVDGLTRLIEAARAASAGSDRPA